MNRRPVHVLFTIDCEPAGRTSQLGPSDWDVGVRALDAFLTTVRNAGFEPTVFATPEVVDAHAITVDYSPAELKARIEKLEDVWEQAMKIGKPVFKAMATMKDGSKPDWISSDCPLGGHHIAQGMDENGLNQAQMAHPLTLLRKAYAI